MLKRLLITVLLVFCSGFLLTVAAQNAAQKSGTPENVIKSFYSWYVHALNKNLDPLSKKQRPQLEKFVSARVIANVERQMKNNEYNADFFISAQDFDENWERNITVSNVSVNKTKATANVFLKGKNGFDDKLKVTLIQEKGSWKISNVEPRN